MSAQGGASAEWATRRERSQVPVVRFMVWLSLLLGRPLSRVVLRGIAVYFLLFSPGSRKALQRYYQHLWQRPAGWAQLYRHFLSFATPSTTVSLCSTGRWICSTSVSKDARRWKRSWPRGAG